MVLTLNDITLVGTKQPPRNRLIYLTLHIDYIKVSVNHMAGIKFIVFFAALFANFKSALY